VSIELSLSRDRSLVVKIPAAENALSASTDVGETVISIRVHCLQIGASFPSTVK